MKDYYETLGVQPDTTEEEIRARYRYLAFVYHPDRFSDPEHKSRAEDDFKRINEAFAVLCNLEKRSKYDMLRGKQPISYASSDTRQKTKKITRSDVIDLLVKAKQGFRFPVTIN